MSPWFPTLRTRVRSYLFPGVTRRELARPRSIAHVETRTAGVLGATERGPTTPVLVTSTDGFERVYGDAIEGSYVTEAVTGFFRNGGTRCYVGRVTGATATAATTLVDDAGADAFGVSAVGPGAWGARVAVTVADAASGHADEFALTVRYWRDLGGATTPDVATLGPPTVEETHEPLSVAPSAPVPLKPTVNGASALVTVTRPSDGHRPANGTTFLDGPGADPGPALAAFEGSTGPDGATGLAAFAEIDEIAVLCAPDASAVPGLPDALVAHCETLRDRIVVLDTPRSPGDVGSLSPPVDSKWAAVYYPWLVVPEPTAGTVVPPSGHVAGVYARTEAQRGVHKPPANEPIRGATGLRPDVTDADQATLNPRGVNCIRSFSGRGTLVWGARTTSSDPEWRYVNVVRLVASLEESIEDGLAWVAHEPNTGATRASVAATVESFLTTQWRNGALQGATPGDAFVVRCDRSTTTQADVDAGRLVVQVGVATVRPAEFTVFEVTLATAEGA